MNLFACLLIGLFNGTCGVAYKIGDSGKVSPVQCAACVSLFGMVVFGLTGHSEWQFISRRIVLTGAICGGAQYLGLRMLKKALSLGPLSPVWCAQSLNFILVIIYSTIWLKEPLSLWQFFSLLAAISSIFAASFGAEGGGRIQSKKQIFLYGLLLIWVLFCTGILSIGMKFGTVYREPGQTLSLMNRSGNLMMFFINLFQALLCIIELTLHRQWVFNRPALISGSMIALCGIAGCLLTVIMVSRTSAILLFVVANATSILTASLISVFCFKERKSLPWISTIAFSLLAILLNRP